MVSSLPLPSPDNACRLSDIVQLCSRIVCHPPGRLVQLHTHGIPGTTYCRPLPPSYCSHTPAHCLFPTTLILPLTVSLLSQMLLSFVYFTSILSYAIGRIPESHSQQWKAPLTRTKRSTSLHSNGGLVTPNETTQLLNGQSCITATCTSNDLDRLNLHRTDSVLETSAG